MSAGRSRDQRSAEQRAEEFMQRVTSDASRRINWFVGRAREEIEDIVAEARTFNAGAPTRSSRPGTRGKSTANR